MKTIQAICVVCGAKFDTYKGKCGTLSVKCPKCRRDDYEKQRRKENTGQTSRSRHFVAPSRESMKQAEEKQRILDWALSGGVSRYFQSHAKTSDGLCADVDSSPADEGSIYSATVEAVAVSDVPR